MLRDLLHYLACSLPKHLLAECSCCLVLSYADEVSFSRAQYEYPRDAFLRGTTASKLLGVGWMLLHDLEVPSLDWQRVLYLAWISDPSRRLMSLLQRALTS